MYSACHGLRLMPFPLADVSCWAAIQVLPNLRHAKRQILNITMSNKYVKGPDLAFMALPLHGKHHKLMLAERKAVGEKVVGPRATA